MHNIFVVTADFYFYKLACKLYDEFTAKLSLLLYACCFMTANIVVKTFANSIETSFMIIAMYYFI